jgi:hypothetical protein
MELTERIKDLLDQHERFKEFWVNIWTEVIWEWLILKEKMERVAWELESEYDEEKLAIERDKWLRYAELKDIPTKITDKAVESILVKELYDRNVIQVRRKNVAKLLRDTAKNIENYTNNSKLNIRTTTNI